MRTKNVLAVVLLALLPVLAMGQRLPAELPQNNQRLRFDYQEALTAFERELARPDVDFTLYPVERLTYNVGVSVQAIGATDSWGRQLLMPESIRKRVAEECTKYDVIVGISDSGVDETHKTYDPNWFLPSANFTGDPNKHWHGTHVAGIVVQLLEPLLQKGTAKLIDLQTLNSNGSGNFQWGENMVQHTIDVFADDVKKGTGVIVNTSWGCTCPLQQGFDDKVKAAVNDHGITFISSNGNTGGETNSYPASSKYTIGSAALNEKLERSSFSTIGNFTDAATPGSNINSTLPGGAEGNASGTSMSAPFLSGLAGLAFGKHGPKVAGANMQPYLRAICEDLPPNGWDKYTGAGLPYISNILETDPCDVPGVDCSGQDDPGDDPGDQPGDDPVRGVRELVLHIPGTYRLKWAVMNTQNAEALGALDYTETLAEVNGLRLMEVRSQQAVQWEDFYLDGVTVRLVSNKFDQDIGPHFLDFVQRHWPDGRRGYLLGAGRDVVDAGDAALMFLKMFAEREGWKVEAGNGLSGRTADGALFEVTHIYKQK
jgi:hypothetical protein